MVGEVQVHVRVPCTYFINTQIYVRISQQPQKWLFTCPCTDAAGLQALLVGIVAMTVVILWFFPPLS